MQIRPFYNKPFTTMARRLAAAVIIAAASLLLSSCTSLQPNFEKPTLEITSIEMLPTEGLEAAFDIGLRVNNPNSMALNIIGLSYDLNLEGFKVIQGLGNNIPSIPSYGTSQFHITATTNLMQSFKLFAQLLNRPKNKLKYTFAAKIHLGSTWLPALRLNDSGEINLGQTTSEQQITH